MGFLCESAGKELACNEEDLGSIPGLGRSPGEGIGYPLQYSWVSLVAQLVKNLPTMRDLGSIPGLGRSPGEENSCPLQYSGLENSMDSVVHGVYSAWGNKESDMAETLFSNFQIYKQYCCPTFPHSPPPPLPPSATGNHPSPKLSCLYEFWFFIFLT